LELQQLVDELGYATTQSYVRLANTHSNIMEGFSLYQTIQATLPDSYIDGVYLFNTSPEDNAILPAKPAVIVAEVKRTEDARLLHQKLWNTGNAPFIIISLPSEVRVYSGFNYSVNIINPSNTDDMLYHIPRQANLVREQLADFRASSIDSGQLWENQGYKLDYDSRVDRQLLANLRVLDEQLSIRYSLNPHIRHALIGKYVYLRYLKDRGILTPEWLATRNIEKESIFGSNATRLGLKQLVDALEERFNGKVFPLDLEGPDAPPDAAIRLVARAFSGKQIRTGQLALFDPYDFRFIPVAMLASIYEQFLEDRRKKGAYYTPQPLAEYLFCELNDHKQLKPYFKVLDPSCGSGTFLVTVYQKLIQIVQDQQLGKPLEPEQLADLLMHIYGVEREEDACYVTEFSLLLALLTHIEPPELHKNEQFRFPVLHNTQIYHCDFFDEESVFAKSNLMFDWIIGNPPWFELEKGELKEEKEEKHVRTWIHRHSRNRPVPDSRVSDAFSWRVTDFTLTDGMIGLLLPAKTLFNYKSQRFRKAFFQANRVERITNFSNLQHILFPNSDAPTTTFIYRKRKCTLEDGVLEDAQPIVHNGPFLANQKAMATSQQKEAWLLTINGSEIKIVESSEAERGEASTWKMALWGTNRDNRMLTRFQNQFPKTFGQLVLEKSPTWHFSEGPQLRYEEAKEETDHVPELEGMPLLDVDALNKAKNRLTISDNCVSLLPKSRCYVRKGRLIPIKICKPPHLFIHSSWNCIVFSEDYLIIPPRQWGLASTDEKDADFLRALSIYFSSTLVEYFLFFKTPSRGIERDTLTKKDVEKIPIPTFSKDQIARLADFQKSLVDLEHRGVIVNSSDIQFELDQIVMDALVIPKQLMQQARDFIEIRYSLNDGKVASTNAIRKPAKAELQVYGELLSRELDTFTQRRGIRHKVDLCQSGEFVLCSIEFVRATEPVEVQVWLEGDKTLPSFWKDVWKMAQERFSQWVYVQRELKIFEYSRIFVLKPARLIEWSRTQAFNDSASLIADILTASRS